MRSYAELIVRCPYCRVGNEFRPMVRRAEGWLAGWPMLSESRSLRGLPHPSRAFCGRVGSGHEHDTHPLSPPRRPLRFDLDNPFRPRRIVNKAAPFPILRPRHQSSLHRVTMNVAKLLDAFGFAPYRKIIVADLPKPRQ